MTAGDAPSRSDHADSQQRFSTEGGLLSIGELATRTGVSTRTVRYYEELGILPAPERTRGGTRRYPEEYILLVEGARKLKELGFGLDDIAELGRFALGTPHPERIQRILTKKLTELNHRVAVLKRLQRLLRDASASTKDSSSTGPALLRWMGESRDADLG